MLGCITVTMIYWFVNPDCYAYATYLRSQLHYRCTIFHMKWQTWLWYISGSYILSCIVMVSANIGLRREGMQTLIARTCHVCLLDRHFPDLTSFLDRQIFLQLKNLQIWVIGSDKQIFSSQNIFQYIQSSTFILFPGSPNASLRAT